MLSLIEKKNAGGRTKGTIQEAVSSEPKAPARLARREIERDEKKHRA